MDNKEREVISVAGIEEDLGTNINIIKGIASLAHTGLLHNVHYSQEELRCAFDSIEAAIKEIEEMQDILFDLVSSTPA